MAYSLICIKNNLFLELIWLMPIYDKNGDKSGDENGDINVVKDRDATNKKSTEVIR